MLAPDSTVPALTDDTPHALARRRRRAVGVPRRRHDRGREVRGPRLPPPRMSYTLTGRIQSRLGVGRAGAASLALALHRWWAIELVALMLVDRARRSTSSSTTARSPYQPGWLALPLGVGRARTRLRARCARSGSRRRSAARSLLYARRLARARRSSGTRCFPRLRLEYGESGGELGRAGALTAAAVARDARRRPRRRVRGAAADGPPARHRAGAARDPPRRDARRRRRARRHPSSARATSRCAT